MTPGAPSDAEVDSAVTALLETRERTLQLVRHLDSGTLETVHSPLLSPLVWDLGHIAAFEDLWISRTFEQSMLRPELLDVYDADETPRAGRGKLPFLRTAGAFQYLADVRARTTSLLARGDRLADRHRLELIVRHEQQHNETMLQTFQLAHLPSAFNARGEERSTAVRPEPEMVRIEGGEAPIGSDPDSGFAYDNEKPRHVVRLAAFEIGKAPVSNAEWLQFVEDGGYRQEQWWSPEGWRWLTEEGATGPLSWTERGRQWRLGKRAPIDPDEPVTHISWFEADAYARSRGARLPTEFEWELAATWDPDTGGTSRNPWGNRPASPDLANLDQLHDGPLPIGSHPDGASPTGLLAMIGDVWEWTSSWFDGYPGFVAYPYREYSEQFFGARYRVLRGCSWATRPRVASVSFRNWDFPQRRQIFCGMRLARDVR